MGWHALKPNLARCELTTLKQGELGQHRHLIGLPVGCHKCPFLRVLGPKSRFPQTLKIQGVNQDHLGQRTVDKVRGQQVVDHTCEGTERTGRRLRAGRPPEGAVGPCRMKNIDGILRRL